MSHERPESCAGRGRGAGEEGEHVAAVDGRVRWSRHAGSASTGSRSTSRTRKRNERERAPITIEARIAIDSGAAASSSSSTASREARWREIWPSRGTSPPR